MAVFTVVEEMGAVIGRQLGYLYDYHRNLDYLKEQVEKLDDTRERLRLSVNEACRQGDVIFPDVQKWLKRAEGIIQEATKLTEEEEASKTSCFGGRCPHLKSRYQLGKKAKKLAGKVVVINEASDFNRISYRPLPQSGLGFSRLRGYEGSESRTRVLNEIMNALRDDEFDMIGIWGMGGVGKSILAKQAASQALEDNLFDIVVTAHVSVTPDVRKIQQEIADMFYLHLTEEIETRANLLFQRLKKQNRILIIFYDIWGKLDLGEVGIPWGEEHRRCKIMLISRNHHVLKAMNTQIEFLVKPLSEEEAWRLFKKTAGHSVEETDLQSIADEVAKQCAGLPFAIVTVAKALKNMSMYKWKDALQQLKRSVRTSIRGVDEIIYTSLKLSYDHLISNEARTLFLLCGLLGYCDIPMDHLLKFSVSLGLLEGIDTLEAQTNRLLLLVHHLKASSLLLPAEDDNYVRMHNVVRHVAIEIASKDRHWCVVREGDRLLNWSKIEESVECSGISLNCKNVYVLPEGLVCPKLTFFQLYGNSPKFENPDTFFKGMEELKVLDLSKMHFASLPSSFCSLRNLRTLCLEQCELGDMFLLGELKTLEVLSFVDSHIKELPREMAKLSHLRLLDLRNCSALEVIPQNIISQLSQLEHLCMENSFTQWGAEGFHNQGSNACLSELKHLYLLRTLHVQIPDADLLPENLFTENLTRYRIFIGDEWSGSGNCATSRILKVGKVRNLHLMDRICKLLKRTGGLYLNGIDTKNVLSELAGEGFLELEYLYIQNSAEMQYIINSEEWLPGASAFPVLKSLSLDNLIHLKEICHGPLPMRSFCNLLFLTVENCSILLNVVSFKMLHSLQNLEVLTVKNCDLLEEVFNLEGLDTHGGQMLPKLRELNVIDLPKLKHICNNGLGRIVEQEGADGATDMVEFPQLSSVSLKSLPSLTGFYPGSQTLERLQPGDFDHPLFNEKVSFSCNFAFAHFITIFLLKGQFLL